MRAHKTAQANAPGGHAALSNSGRQSDPLAEGRGGCKVSRIPQRSAERKWRGEKEKIEGDGETLV